MTVTQQLINILQIPRINDIISLTLVNLSKEYITKEDKTLLINNFNALANNSSPQAFTHLCELIREELQSSEFDIIEKNINNLLYTSTITKLISKLDFINEYILNIFNNNNSDIKKCLNVLSVHGNYTWNNQEVFNTFIDYFNNNKINAYGRDNIRNEVLHQVINNFSGDKEKLTLVSTTLYHKLIREQLYADAYVLLKKGYINNINQITHTKMIPILEYAEANNIQFHIGDKLPESLVIDFINGTKYAKPNLSEESIKGIQFSCNLHINLKETYQILKISQYKELMQQWWCNKETKTRIKSWIKETV